MIRVARHSIAHNLGQNSRVAPFRVFERLQDENSRALANHEAVAVGVKRAAGVFRVIVAGRKRFHRGESAHAHRGDGRFGAAANHDLRVPVLDHAKGIPHRVRGSRACRRGRRIRPLRSVADGNVP